MSSIINLYKQFVDKEYREECISAGLEDTYPWDSVTLAIRYKDSLSIILRLDDSCEEMAGEINGLWENQDDER